MPVQKSGRNKTINLSVGEGAEYLDRCLTLKRSDIPVDPDKVLDRTIHGDCLKIMPYLPEGFADLLIADPPYNLTKDFGEKHYRKVSDEEYMEYTDRWLRRALPLLKPEATVYVCCDWQCSSAIETVLKRYLHVRNRITWQREKGRGALTNWKNGMEDIWFATKKGSYTFHVENVMVRRKVRAPYREGGRPKDWEETETGNFRNTYPSNFWDDITVPYWSMQENTTHPAQKPEKLLAKLILASSDPGDVVFDPFVGSGSTSVTAKKLGRHYVGIERDARYCIYTEKRLEMAETDKTIQGYSNGIFWERNATPRRSDVSLT